MNNVKYKGDLYPVRKITDFKDMISQSADLFGDSPAYLQKDKPGGTFCPISYRKVKDDMDALGTKLLDMGLKGEKIGVIGETCYQWILTYFTTVSGVGVIVPLDKNLPEVELNSLVERSGIKAIVYTSRLEKKLKKLFENPGTIEYFISMGKEEHTDNVYSLNKLVEEGQKLLCAGIRDYVDVEIDPDQLATLMFTSGTTGFAKGVMLSHKNIINNVYQMSKYVKIPEGGVILSILPVHHAYEFTCSICTTFYQGKTIAICEGIKYVQKNMNEVKANIMLGVPLVFEKMYKGMWKQAEQRGEAEKLRKAIDLSKKLKLYNSPKLMKKLFKAIHQSFGNNIKLFIAGGAAIDPKVIEDFEAMGLPMIQGYGMSEHAPLIAVNQDRCSKAASVGLPLPGTEIKIEDQDEYGVGEIVVKGDSVMMGYFDNPEATAEVLKDGWLYTGDLGYFDKEGYLYLNGRKKTVIVTKGGKNIYPEEVETVFLENELIKEILVYGKTDEKVGNVILTADIFPNYQLLEQQNGKMTGSEVYHFYKDLVDKINEKFPPYKVVKRINIRETEFDKTTTGKIKRYGNKTGQEGAGLENTRKAEMFMKSITEGSNSFVKYRDNRPVSDLKNLLETSCNAYENNIAFKEKTAANDQYKDILYKDLYADVNGLGTALINKVDKESKIAIIGENSVKWVEAYLATVCGVGAAVPLDKNLSDEEIKKYMEDSEASCAFFDEEYEALFTEIRKTSPFLKVLVSMGETTNEDVIKFNDLVEEGKKQIGLGDRQFLDKNIDPDEMAVLLYGEDIKGMAKGIVLTHKNIVVNLMSMASVIRAEENDIFFSILPAHSQYEATCGLLFPIYRGASVAFPFNREMLLDDITEANPTMVVGVPYVAKAFIRLVWEKAKELGKEKRLQSAIEGEKNVFGIEFNKITLKDILANYEADTKLLIISKEPIHEDLAEIFRNIGIDVIEGYGFSEAAPLVAINPENPKEMKKGSVGRILPGMEISIDYDNGKDYGEVLVKGQNIMKEYYKDQSATEEVLKDGWLYTGNVGCIDEDNFVYLESVKANKEEEAKEEPNEDEEKEPCDN